MKSCGRQAACELKNRECSAAVPRFSGRNGRCWNRRKGKINIEGRDQPKPCGNGSRQCKGLLRTLAGLAGTMTSKTRHVVKNAHFLVKSIIYLTELS